MNPIIDVNLAKGIPLDLSLHNADCQKKKIHGLFFNILYYNASKVYCALMFFISISFEYTRPTIKS